MPQNITCDSADGEPASFVISNLDTGETKGYCSGCMVGFGLALALATLGPEGILEHIGPVHVTQPEPEPAEGKGKRDRKREPEPAQAEEPPPNVVKALEEIEAATSDG